MNDVQEALILVADDDPDIRSLVELRLGQDGHRVIAACDGDEALELARRHHPDLVLLDVNMPEASGFEVAGAIRRDESLADIKVMMLTARVMDKDVERGYAYGVADYVKKPFEGEDLRFRVAAALMS